MAPTEHDASGASNNTSTPDEASATLSTAFLRLLDVVTHLRSPQGCPWDQKQTPQSLLPYLLEETYEVIESIEDNNPQGLKEELGDVLLHILFQSLIAQEQGHFHLEECLSGITDKLIRRHPHVFSDNADDNAAATLQKWETAKQQEKGRASLLDGLPRGLPALTHARRVQEKAASVGFDWQDIAPVWAKVHEEIGELQQACTAADTNGIEEEFGDILFSLVNVGRFLQLDPEAALRNTIRKFTRRFHGIEQEFARRGQRLNEVSLEDMDAVWNRLRRQDKSQEAQ